MICSLQDIQKLEKHKNRIKEKKMEQKGSKISYDNIP